MLLSFELSCIQYIHVCLVITYREFCPWVYKPVDTTAKARGWLSMKICNIDAYVIRVLIDTLCLPNY